MKFVVIFSLSLDKTFNLNELYKAAIIAEYKQPSQITYIKEILTLYCLSRNGGGSVGSVG